MAEKTLPEKALDIFNRIKRLNGPKKVELQLPTQTIRIWMQGKYCLEMGDRQQLLDGLERALVVGAMLVITQYDTDHTYASATDPFPAEMENLPSKTIYMRAIGDGRTAAVIQEDTKLFIAETYRDLPNFQPDED